MPTFKLDGKDVEFAPGEMIIEAAARAGVNIPYYCYHPELSRPANCRMCLVELEGAPKLIPSCQQACNDKMKIQTASPRVKSAQADVMEFLLVNHPLDCPICDQAGECKLQQYAYLFGKSASSMEEAKVKLEKRKVLGPHVVLDQERCIACTRCVRFTSEITKTGELAMVARSNHNTVDLHPGAELNNAYSGCVVDMCPVGALTDRQFRFQARVWYVQPIVTTCTLCSRGCNISADRRGERHRRSQVKRIRARRNPEVNGSWICDVGRYGYLQPREGQRPTEARGTLAGGRDKVASREGASEEGRPDKDGGTGWFPPGQAHADVRLGEAQERAAELLQLHAGERGWLGVIASGSETLEELEGLKALALSADPSAALVVPAREDAPEDEILLRTDKTPNQRGARLLGWEGDPGALAGRKVLLVVDGDLRPDGGLAGIIPDQSSDVPVITMVAHERRWTASAEVVLPLANAYEKDGTIVNFDGVIQRLHRVVPPAGDCRPAHHHASDIAALAGLAAIETDTEEVLRTLCAGTLAPLDPARLNEWGARLPAAEGGEVVYFGEPLQLFTAAPKAYAEGEYLPFLKSQVPTNAIHVGAGIPSRDGDRADWFGPVRTSVEEPAAPAPPEPPPAPAAGSGSAP